MLQSNGGQVSKDHEDDSDSKATLPFGSNLINSFWFLVSVTLALFLSPIIFFSLQHFSFTKQTEIWLQKSFRKTNDKFKNIVNF